MAKKTGVWLRATPWPFKFSVVPGKGLAVNTPSESGEDVIVFGDEHKRTRVKLHTRERVRLQDRRIVLAEQ